MEVRPIDANALKAALEEDGHLSPYIEEFIDACPTVVVKEFTIDDLKRALVEVKRYCENRSKTLEHPCDGCEFCGRYCLIDNCPEFWGTNEWERRLKDGSDC